MKQLCIKFENLIVIFLNILLFCVIIYVLFNKNKEGFTNTPGKPKGVPNEIKNPEDRKNIPVSGGPSLDDTTKIKSETDRLNNETNIIREEIKTIQNDIRVLSIQTNRINQRIANLNKLVFE